MKRTLVMRDLVSLAVGFLVMLILMGGIIAVCDKPTNQALIYTLSILDWAFTTVTGMLVVGVGVYAGMQWFWHRHSGHARGDEDRWSFWISRRK